MRLLTCAGGTGGGVYPALTVLQALINKKDLDKMASYVQETDLPILWVGSEGGMEMDLVRRVGIPFQTIPAAGIHGVGLRSLPGNLLQLARGYRESYQILDHFQPDVLFFTGGYIAFPMALAGSGKFSVRALNKRVSKRRIPQALFVPDIEPGLALRNLARFADVIAVPTEESRTYFPNDAPVIVTGYPVRSELKSWSRDQAQRVLGLIPDLPTLLVFGGSTGARSINRALLASLSQLLGTKPGTADMQIIHISGHRDWPEVQAAIRALPTDQVNYYHAYPYLHNEMGAALRAADLVLSRAGASCLGEYPAFGLPAILVPYPHSWRYQQVNAEYLARHGAAVILADTDISIHLAPVVRSLIGNQIRLAQMSSAMQRINQPDGANKIADLIYELAVGEK